MKTLQHGFSRLAWRGLAAGLVLLCGLGAAQAAINLDGATVNGGASTTAVTGTNVVVSVTVTTSGGGVANDWGSLAWRFDTTTPATLACDASPNITNSGTRTLDFNFPAPTTPGTYNLYLQAYNSNDCSGGSSGRSNILALSGAVVTVYPAVTSITRASADPAEGSRVTWTVTFNAPVTGVNAADFVLVPGGDVVGAGDIVVTGSGATRTVTATTGAGAGTLGLDLVDDDSIIAGGVRLGGPGAGNGNFTGEVYTIEGRPLVHYRMDEGAWSGVAGEVRTTDSRLAINGQAYNGATTAVATPAIAGNPGTCRYGVFDNNTTITRGHVALPSFPNLTSDFTIAGWIRTTDNAGVSGQRIFIDDASNSGGYGFSLNDGGARTLRLYSRGVNPVSFDSNYVINNNTWYFVAAVVDITNRRRVIYVFSAAGALLNVATEGVAFTGTWGTDAGVASIGGELNGSGESPTATTFHFKGNLDEIRVYGKTLSQAALASLARETHPCPSTLDHVRLDHTGDGVTCVGSVVTVNACSSPDSAGVCTASNSGLVGNVLARNAGGAVVATVPFSIPAGSSSMTVSVPVTTAQTVSLETSALSAPTLASQSWTCWNGSTASCSHVFSDAGFIFAAASGGPAATVPSQVAGLPSATHYLRAVKRSTSSQACEAALTGATAVDFAYECNNPATCSAANLMVIDGGTPATISRNDNGGVGSYQPVNLSFDANGNAPLTFVYRDAGRVTLHARKAAGGALLTALDGSSNAFVVKPGSLVATATTPLGGANPASSTTAGSAFVAAGDPFTVLVQGYTAGATPTVTPNFGNEAVTPTVGFVNAANVAGNIHALVAPTANAPSAGVLTTGPSSSGNGGGVTGTVRVTDNIWSEVGAFNLKPALADYLGAGAVAGAVSGTIGRFRPYQYEVSGTLSVCSSPVFAYAGQPLTGTLTVTAQNRAGSTTTNYGKGASSLATLAPSMLVLGGLDTGLEVDTASPLYSLTFVAGQDFNTRVDGTAAMTAAVPVRMSALPSSPITSVVKATGVGDEVGLVANAPAPLGASTPFRQGRLSLVNAYGSDVLPLRVPLRAEYYDAGGWKHNTDDTCTTLPVTAVALGNRNPAGMGAGVSSIVPMSSTSPGVATLIISPPASPGVLDLSLDLGTGTGTLPAATACLPAWVNGPNSTTGAARPYLSGNWCGANFDKAPAARLRFGSPRAPYIYLRERY